MPAKLESKPLGWFRPDPRQPRKQFDKDELLRLGASLKVRQNDPLQAFIDGLLIDGERRWRAAELVGLGALDVIVTDAKLSEAQVSVIRITSFFHKADLSGYEKYLACAELMCMNPGWQLKDLADALHVDPSMVTRLLSPSRCVPEWQEALKAGAVSLSDCYAASKRPGHEQSRLLALKLNGASRDAIEAVGRKSRSSSAPAVRLNNSDRRPAKYQT